MFNQLRRAITANKATFIRALSVITVGVMLYKVCSEVLYLIRGQIKINEQSNSLLFTMVLFSRVLLALMCMITAFRPKFAMITDNPFQELNPLYQSFFQVSNTLAKITKLFMLVTTNFMDLLPRKTNQAILCYSFSCILPKNDPNNLELINFHNMIMPSMIVISHIIVLQAFYRLHNNILNLATGLLENNQGDRLDTFTP